MEQLSYHGENATWTILVCNLHGDNTMNQRNLEQILRNNYHIFVVKLPSTTIPVCNLHGDNTMKMHAIPSPLDIRL